MRRKYSSRLVRLLVRVERREALLALSNASGQILRRVGGPEATLAARRWRKSWKRRLDRAHDLARLVDALVAFSARHP